MTFVLAALMKAENDGKVIHRIIESPLGRWHGYRLLREEETMVGISIEYAEKHKKNVEHAENPVIGDYWMEMFTPILVVVGRPAPEKVLICRKTRETDKDHWTWDLERLEVLSLTDFSEYLRYKSPDMCEKFWADCLPEHMKWVKKEAVKTIFGEDSECSQQISS